MSLQSGQIEPPPEVQQSQQGVKRNPNAYRSMRDHIHPPRVGALSCIIPRTEDVSVRPYLVPLLPTFHGMENENPYTHIRKMKILYRVSPLLHSSSMVLHPSHSHHNSCHAPIPGPTRLANLNRFRGAKPYIGTLYFFFFFLSELNLYLWVYK